MRVLIIQQNLPPYIIDGVRIHTYDLAQGLAKQGLDVHVITERSGIHKNVLGTKGLEEFPWNSFTVHQIVPVIKELDWLSYIILVGKYIKKLIKEYKFDIIHAHGPHAGFLVYYRPKIPAVVTIHGTFATLHDTIKNTLSLSSWGLIKRTRILSGAKVYSMFEKAACQRANVIIALTKKEKERIINNYKINSSRIVVIPNGIDIERLKKMSSKTVIDLEVKKPIVLFIGRLTVEKGIIQLLQAWRILKDYKREGTLIIAGSGYLKSFIEKYSEKIPGIVLFKNASRNTLLKLYEIADIFVLPSLFEGLPYTLLEALAFGKPLVVSSLLGLEELLGNAALYANPLNPRELALKLRLLIDDKELRIEFSKKAKSVAVNFLLDKIITKIIKVYKRMLSK